MENRAHMLQQAGPGSPEPRNEARRARTTTAAHLGGMSGIVDNVARVHHNVGPFLRNELGEEGGGVVPGAREGGVVDVLTALGALAQLIVRVGHVEDFEGPVRAEDQPRGRRALRQRQQGHGRQGHAAAPTLPHPLDLFCTPRSTTGTGTIDKNYCKTASTYSMYQHH